MVFSIAIQICLLLLLFAKDKNDGEKELFKRQQWSISEIAIVLLLTEGHPLYFVFVVYIFLKLNIDLRPLIHSLSNRDIIFYVYSVALFLLILLFKFKFRQNINILGFRSNNLRKNISLGLMVALAAFLMIDGLYFLLLPKQFESRIVEMITTLENPSDYLMLFLGTVLLGPFVEEIVYRGVLYSPFRKKYGSLKAIIIVSLIFGLAHPGFINAFSVGIFLTILYEKSESIISTFVAHSVHNLLVILTAFYVLK